MTFHLLGIPQVLFILAILTALLSSARPIDDAASGRTEETQQQQQIASGPPLFDRCPEHAQVEENPDPGGEPGMLPCATRDEDLESFYKTCMEPDFAPWRAKAPLRDGDIAQLMLRWGLYGPHQQGFILIYKNKWYYPFLKAWNHRQTSPDEVQEEITLWVAATQYYFDQMARDVEFPDVFLFISDLDTGACPDRAACAIPAFSITKNTQGGQRKDLLVPFMCGSHLPLYNFPFQLKHPQAFFSGRPNWGASPRIFPPPGGTNATSAAAGSPLTPAQQVFSRQHLAALSVTHGETLMASLVVPDPEAYPGMRTRRAETHMRDHARWKFLLHLDGVTYSSRLSRIMHTNSVVLKEESFWPEYFVRAMQPGVHYLPILKDGPDDVLDVVRTWSHQELELRRIAFNAQQFVVRFLCPTARMLYFRRMLREYKALFDDPTTGRNALQEFLEREIVPIIRARERGDTNFTYNYMRPYKKGQW